MSEDAPVNTGAVAWPDDFTASVMVRRMQAKLHRWATDDPGRCFGDLFNLVYDPAFLVHAWERVSTNKGAQTAGIDQATAARVENGVGVVAFLGQIRDSLKAGEFRPVEARRVMIPKGNTGKFRKLGIPTVQAISMSPAGTVLLISRMAASSVRDRGSVHDATVDLEPVFKVNP